MPTKAHLDEIESNFKCYRSFLNLKGVEAGQQKRPSKGPGFEIWNTIFQTDSIFRTYKLNFFR